MIPKIKHLYTQWQLLQPLKPENKKRLDEKFRLEFNYNSNHLEGNTLTYGQTKLLLMFDQTDGSHELREYEEMKAHDVALKMITQEALDKERPLTESFIRNLNETILVRPFYKEAQTPEGQPTRRLIDVGTYKSHPNSVLTESGEIFEYATPQETPALMTDLVAWYNAEANKNELTPVELAALLHYKYIRIHPFDDGNGRVARLLVNYVLYCYNYPPIIIKTADKKNYLRALRLADSGNLKAFIDYMAQQAEWSLTLGIKAAKGETIEEDDDLDKKIALLKQEMGEKNDAQILKCTPELIEEALRNSIFPLLKEWDKMLQKFDVFFMSRQTYIYFGERSIEEVDINDHTLFTYLADISKKHSFFDYKGYFEELRKSTSRKEIAINIPSISVQFEKHSYLINIQNNTIDLLYTEQLSKEKIQELVTLSGNSIYEQIQKAR